MNDFESVEIFKDELFRHAVEVCRNLCPKYWSDNRNLFAVSSKTPEDLVQYILESAWVRRYQLLVDSNPELFTIDTFRKRFYVAARRVCSIQNRHQRAQCRHDEESWAVELTESEEGLNGVSEILINELSPTANRLLTLSSFHITEPNPLKRASETLAPYLGSAAIRAAMTELSAIRPTHAPMNSELRAELDADWKNINSQLRSIEPMTPTLRDELLQLLVRHRDDKAHKGHKTLFIQSYLPLGVEDALTVGVNNWHPNNLIARLTREYGKVLDTWVDDFVLASQISEVWESEGLNSDKSQCPNGEILFERLKTATRQVIYNPQFAQARDPKSKLSPNDTASFDTDSLQDTVAHAKATGTIRKKTPCELSIELLTDFFSSLPPAQHEEAYFGLIDQLGSNPTGETRKKRLINLTNHSRGLLLADYQILSEFLELPINPAASPVIILKAANDKLRQSPGLDIPTYVNEVLNAIRLAVMDDPSRESLSQIPASFIPTSETTTRGGNSVATVKNLSVNRNGSVVEVYPIEGSATLLWEDLLKYPAWETWLQSMDIQATLTPSTTSGGKILLEGEWVDGLSTANLRQMLMGMVVCMRQVGKTEVLPVTTISKPCVSTTQPAPTPPVLMGKLCGCGCGEQLKRLKAKFKQGHNMRPKANS